MVMEREWTTATSWTRDAVGLDLTKEDREPCRVVSGGVFRFSEGIQSGDEEDGSGAV